MGAPLDAPLVSGLLLGEELMQGFAAPKLLRALADLGLDKDHAICAPTPIDSRGIGVL